MSLSPTRIDGRHGLTETRVNRRIINWSAADVWRPNWSPVTWIYGRIRPDSHGRPAYSPARIDGELRWHRSTADMAADGNDQCKCTHALFLLLSKVRSYAAQYARR